MRDEGRDLRSIYLSLLSRLYLERPAEGIEILRRFGLPEGDGKSGELRQIFDQMLGQLNLLPFDILLRRAEEDACWYASHGVKILSALDDDYPPLLKEVEDAPPVLFMRGAPVWRLGKTLSVVGTRLASAYGKDAAGKVVRWLQEGGHSPVVVSGLACGIDIAAHRAALECGAPTVAVLPNGMDRIYPYVHREDAERIAESGALITEYPRGFAPLRHYFIKRNRIIAAISYLTVIVESRVKGGAMTTVEMANSYNREVFAVPGRMGDPNSFGCNYLISKHIANICADPAAIPEVMGWKSNLKLFQRQQGLFMSSAEERKRLLSLLSRSACVTVESLIPLMGMEYSAVQLVLLDLELAGKILSTPSGYKLS